MDGKYLWMKIFNTDFEEAVLGDLGLEKDFEDEGTEEENAKIVEALDGKTLRDVFDMYFRYNGHGLDMSDIDSMFDMLDVTDWNNLKE